MNPHPQPRTPTWLATAARIGERLCRQAIWDAERCNWLGAALEWVDGQWQPVQRSFGPELYDGTSGIAWFLAELYRQTGTEAYRRTALGALAHAEGRRQADAQDLTLGCYSGAAGLAYAAAQVGDLCAAPTATAQALQGIDDLLRRDYHDQGLDITDGCAGAIPVLLKFHSQLHHADAGALALTLGDHLIARAQRHPYGWSWDTLAAPAPQAHLTGMAHGAAGIAYALLELHAATGEARFRDAALHGFAYERHWFNARHGNWPDLRELAPDCSPQDHQHSYPVYWCHGAPGIGMTRLRAYQLTGDAHCLQEARAALQTTRRQLDHVLAGAATPHPPSFDENFSLCHGLAGNAELLLFGYQVLQEPDLLAAAQRIGAYGRRRYERNGRWPCGVPDGGATPGLMLGLAGIGHFYLRLADPAGVAPATLIV